MSRAHARYVQPHVSEARVNRLWGNVSARLEARASSGRRGFLLSGTAVLVAGLGAALVLHPAAPQPSPRPRQPGVAVQLQTAATTSSYGLAEGSQVSLAARSALVVSENTSSAVSLSLSHGEAKFDVTHQEARRFTVTARDVLVRVIGTQFTVKAETGPDPRIEVVVLRGVVEVESKRRPGVVTRVAAGETWVQNSVPPSTTPVEGAVTSPAPKEGNDVNEGVGRATSDESKPTSSSPSASPSLSARELFEKASERRRVGDASGAAHAYEELLRAHPGDRRAGLSAFELGRLRMDRLGDAPGAVAALERALTLDIGPGFREDALARLVSVFASQGNFSACSRARDRYLKSYPSGVHASTVASRCAAR